MDPDSLLSALHMVSLKQQQVGFATVLRGLLQIAPPLASSGITEKQI